MESFNFVCFPDVYLASKVKLDSIPRYFIRIILLIIFIEDFLGRIMFIILLSNTALHFYKLLKTDKSDIPPTPIVDFTSTLLSKYLGGIPRPLQNNSHNVIKYLYELFCY